MIPEGFRDRLHGGQSLIGRPVLTLVNRDTLGAPKQIEILDAPTARCEAGQFVRRKLVVKIRSRDVPPKGLGTSTRVWVTLQLRKNALEVEPVTLLVGVLGLDGARDDDPGLVTVALESLDAVYTRHGFAFPRQISGSAASSLQQLSEESLPGVRVLMRGIQDRDSGVIELSRGDGGREPAIQRLAELLVGDFGVDRYGQPQVLPLVDRVGPSWLIHEGIDFSGIPSFGLTPQPNVVIVAPEGIESSIVGVAVDDRPDSPGYVGPTTALLSAATFGAEPVAQAGYAPLHTSIITDIPTTGAADSAAVARGVLHRGVRRADVSFQVPCNPWLDWGHPIDAAMRDGTVLPLRVTGFDIPVIPQPTMTVTARME